MPSQYAAFAARIADLIARKGGTVVFLVGDNTPTAPVYDPITNTWSNVTAPVPSGVVGKAIQGDSDPDRFAALGLTMVNPIVLVVAGAGLALRPMPGMPVLWDDGYVYTIKDVQSVAPDGKTVILWDIAAMGGGPAPSA